MSFRPVARCLGTYAPIQCRIARKFTCYDVATRARARVSRMREWLHRSKNLPSSLALQLQFPKNRALRDMRARGTAGRIAGYGLESNAYY